MGNTFQARSLCQGGLSNLQTKQKAGAFYCMAQHLHETAMVGYTSDHEVSSLEEMDALETDTINTDHTLETPNPKKEIRIALYLKFIQFREFWR